MPVYAIGDLQGCYDPLRRLLDAIDFDPGSDRLWFTGDLVNRGPDSLTVLRFVRSLGESAVTVLGNHDLHLMAVAAGAARCRTRDTLDAVLEAVDCEDLVRWLASLPLAHYDPTLIIGILFSMFTAIVVTRLIFDFFSTRRRLKSLSI